MRQSTFRWSSVMRIWHWLMETPIPLYNFLTGIIRRFFSVGLAIIPLTLADKVTGILSARVLPVLRQCKTNVHPFYHSSISTSDVHSFSAPTEGMFVACGLKTMAYPSVAIVICDVSPVVCVKTMRNHVRRNPFGAIGSTLRHEPGHLQTKTLDFCTQ